MEPKLYLCPTPIGNLEDITLRTIKTLRNADVIYAEDTRNSIKLLKHYKISKPLLSCHDHNEAQRAEEIASKVISGIPVAYISDAGMLVYPTRAHGLYSHVLSAIFHLRFCPVLRLR